MGTDAKLVHKANKKQWKGLKGGAGGDVRGGSQGALDAGSTQSKNRRTTEGGAATATEEAYDVDTFSEDYDKDGAGNVTVTETADQFADLMPGASLSTFGDTPVALGDSYYHGKYQANDELGIDDLEGANASLGLDAVGAVGVAAPVPGTTDVDLDWVVAGAAPGNFDPTGGRVRVVVYRAEDIGGNGDNAPMTPGGDPSDAPRGILAADGTYVSSTGGIVSEDIEDIATETITLAGLVASTSYVIGLRVEMPVGDAASAGGQAYNFGPWTWQSFATGA